MDAFKKAKEHMQGLQTQLEDKLHLGQSSSDSATATQAPAPSSVQPPSSYPNTSPASAVATPEVNLAVTPCREGNAPTKLSLVARKSVRDEFEPKLEGLNARLSNIMRTPWKCYVDQVGVYSYSAAGASSTKANPGQTFFEYFDANLHHVKKFVDKYGDDGRAQLNRLAFAHTITIEPTEDKETGCDISHGKLRILFYKTSLGDNVDYAFRNLETVVNNAGAAPEAAAGSAASTGSSFSLVAKLGIRKYYEAEIGTQLEQARKILACPDLKFVPNLEANYGKARAYMQKENPNQLHYFEETFGNATLGYFKGFVRRIDEQKFGGDDMLQEGFQEVVDKKEVHLRIVDKLERRNVTECVIEGGILYMQTVPRYWDSAVADSCEGLVDLL